MKKGPLSSPTQRAKLEARREPHWERVEARGFVGYRRSEKGGTWVARWRTEDGKQKYHALDVPIMPFKDEYDMARSAAAAWFKSLRAGVASTSGTVADAGIVYVAGLQAKKGEAAARDAEGRIRRCIGPTLGTVTLDKLTTSKIESWLHALVPEGLDDADTRRARDSANRNLTTLKALLNAAWRAQRVGSNSPWARVKAFAGVGESRKEFLTIEQRHRLLAETDGAFKNLIEAALLTGARYGELCALRVECFDARRKTLEVREGKTGPRSVPLSDAAVKLFSRLSKAKLPAAYLLARSDGAPWQTGNQIALMRAAVIKARLPAATVFYVLRHTFIASAINAGLDINSVARVCGTSVRMIEQHYAKLLHGEVRAKLNAVAML